MQQAGVDVQIGNKIGDFFLPRLSEAKERLWIMSPWVSPEYMDLVLRKKEAGVDVRVITSNDYVPGQKEAVGKLIESRVRILKLENKNLKYWGIGLLIGGLVLAAVTAGISLIVAVIGLGLYIAGRERSETYWISKLGENNLIVLESSPYKMVHAKIYVADDMVVMGSANLTGNGLKRNVEAMAIMQNADLATKLCATITDAPRLSNLREVPYNTLGRDVQITVPTRRYYRRRRR